MEETPTANRPHIAVFGRRNVGKSSLINALTNQELALVSEFPGTTADPVYKRMELQPLGPVVMIDTAGIDDTGSLGELRVKKTREVIRRSDLALLIIDCRLGIGDFEKQLFTELTDNQVPVIPVVNKKDMAVETEHEKLNRDINEKFDKEAVFVSALEDEGIESLRDKIAGSVPDSFEKAFIVGDLIAREDVVVLVTPIDMAAPKGRLILPQVQTIRDIIDHNGIAVICKETELKETLNGLERKPRLVITDSQVFKEVNNEVPEVIDMTSFSIIFARYKGDMDVYLRGVDKLRSLTVADKILVAEACTHRRQEEDIGTVKIPRWLRERVGAELDFDFVSGREYPENLKEYDLVIHCGGCMLNRKEIISRLREADRAGVPIVNYGMTIAQVHGILDRALKPFPSIFSKWKSVKKNNPGREK